LVLLVQENILRNQSLLASLGLTAAAVPSPAQAALAAARKRPSDSPPAPERRSARVHARHIAAEFEFDAADAAATAALAESDHSSTSAVAIKAEPQHIPSLARGLGASAAVTVRMLSSAATASRSSKDVMVDVSSFHAAHLGQSLVPETGGAMKATALAALAGGTAPRFNKYSGIVEFANAVVLFVNLDGSYYANVFREVRQLPRVHTSMQRL
jgi:hypothetical protein